VCLHAPDLKFDQIVYQNGTTIAIDESGELWLFSGYLNKKVGFNPLENHMLIRHPINLNLMKKNNLKAKKLWIDSYQTHIIAEKSDDESQ